MKKILALICACLLVTALAVAAFADFGDFGGDSDFGGDWGGGGDWDFGGDDDWDNDYDYGGGDSFVGSLFGSLVGNMVGNSVASGDVSIFWLIVIVFIIIIIVNKVRSNKKPVAPRATPTDRTTLKAMSEYLTLDPSFSETELKEKLSNVYVQMQNAWQAKNLETLRPYLTDELYAQYDRQLDNYRRAKQTNRIERIAVLDTLLDGWTQRGGDDVIIATLRTRIVDYVTDDETGSIVRGSNSVEKFMVYEYTLTRKTGTLTSEASGTRVVNCPSCGAPCDINKSAKCEYCGNIITVDSCDWVISGIKGISQRTGN